jgi:hypothetical protein
VSGMVKGNFRTGMEQPFMENRRTVSSMVQGSTRTLMESHTTRDNGKMVSCTVKGNTSSPIKRRMLDNGRTVSGTVSGNTCTLMEFHIMGEWKSGLKHGEGKCLFPN